MTDHDEKTLPLFRVCSTRVYRPNEVPPDVQEKACNYESEHLEPEVLGYNVGD